MNHLPLLFLGIFATFFSSWIGLVLYPYVAIGDLRQTTDPNTEQLVPPKPSGLAVAGQRVYASAGCIYCHSQQVRQPYITTSDIQRGWGNRPTVARDYIHEQPVFLGTMRTGPDLANVGRRWTDANWHHRHLYEPAEVSPGSIMPSYRYLYRIRKIEGQPSRDAVLGLKGKHAPPPGYEVVPTEEAKALVAYLLSLDRSYPLPEAPEPELK